MSTSTFIPTPSEEIDDATALSRVRDGDLNAYALLYERYRAPALRVAIGLAGPTGADDLVAEAFTRVLKLLIAGRGPDEAFLGYVLTSVRNTYYTIYKRSLRIVPVEDIGTVSREPSANPFSTMAEDQLVTAALRSLPPRWQQVIQLATVEGRPLDEVAEILGVSSGAVAQLAFRAREALRIAYLEQHAGDPGTELCRSVVPLIAREARATGPISDARTKRIGNHLESCGPCRGAHAEILAVAGTIQTVRR
jgi:RNA polymerase sigma factor (sigma-70 family)